MAKTGRPTLHAGGSERLRVRVPRDVAQRVGSGTQASRLVSTILEDFYNKESTHQDATRRLLTFKEALSRTAFERNKAEDEARALKRQFHEARQEYANLSRSLQATLRQGGSAMRGRFLTLWHRVSAAEKQAASDERSVDQVLARIRSAEAAVVA